MKKIHKQRLYEAILKCLEGLSFDNKEISFDEQNFDDEININISENGNEM